MFGSRWKPIPIDVPALQTFPLPDPRVLRKPDDAVLREALETGQAGVRLVDDPVLCEAAQVVSDPLVVAADRLGLGLPEVVIRAGVTQGWLLAGVDQKLRMTPGYTDPRVWTAAVILAMQMDKFMSEDEYSQDQRDFAKWALFVGHFAGHVGPITALSLALKTV